jgi:hypothetical protein
MGVDLLSEKYYDISPYAYVANNPLKYVDPNGALIFISIMNVDENGNIVRTKLRYQNGKLYSEDGKTEYDGSDISDPIFQLVRFQLNSIKAQVGHNKEVRDLFAHLEGDNSEHTINVVIGGKNGTETEKLSDDTEITYDPFNWSDPEKPGVELDPRVGLLHELRHSYDNSYGFYNNGLTAWTDIKTGESVLYWQWEAKAMNTENILRKELYGTIRTTYMVTHPITNEWRTITPPKMYLTND